MPIPVYLLTTEEQCTWEYNGTCSWIFTDLEAAKKAFDMEVKSHVNEYANWHGADQIKIESSECDNGHYLKTAKVNGGEGDSAFITLEKTTANSYAFDVDYSGEED